jgi:hypothetical protein
MVWFLFTLCLMRLFSKYQVRNSSYLLLVQEVKILFKIGDKGAFSRLVFNRFFHVIIISWVS